MFVNNGCHRNYQLEKNRNEHDEHPGTGKTFIDRLLKSEASKDKEYTFTFFVPVLLLS
jgi:hypothetical protein